MYLFLIDIFPVLCKDGMVRGFVTVLFFAGLLWELCWIWYRWEVGGEHYREGRGRTNTAICWQNKQCRVSPAQRTEFNNCKWPGVLCPKTRFLANFWNRILCSGKKPVGKTIPSSRLLLSKQNLVVDEKSPGKDSHEYVLQCKAVSPAIPKNMTIPSYDLAFFFYNGEYITVSMNDLRESLCWSPALFRHTNDSTDVPLCCKLCADILISLKQHLFWKRERTWCQVL